jgi:hypothetical protein
VVFIPAALCDDINDGSRGLSKLSPETGGQHLELGDRLLIELRSSATADSVFVRVTIDQKVIVARSFSKHRG